MDTNLSLSAVSSQLRRTMDYMLGKQSADKQFANTSDGLWQALYVNWICAALLGFIPGAIQGLQAYVLFILTSIISSVLYAILVYQVLQRVDKGSVFLSFMVPYYWLNIMQVVIFAVVYLGAQATGIFAIQLAYIPLAIWLLYWIIKVARDQTGLGGLAAVGFLAGRVLVDIALGWAAGSGFAMPA